MTKHMIWVCVIFFNFDFEMIKQMIGVRVVFESIVIGN